MKTFLNWISPQTFAAALLAVAPACSSRSGSSTHSDGGDVAKAMACQTSAEKMSQGGSICVLCMNSHCNPQLGAQATSCVDFLDCICPNGTFDETIASSGQCQGKEQTTACASADNDLVNCEATWCYQPCAFTKCTGGTEDGGCVVTDAGTGG